MVALQDDTAEAVLEMLRRLPPDTQARIAARMVEAHSARLLALAADLSAALEMAGHHADRLAEIAASRLTAPP